jgi:prefoldin subunit 5
MKDNQPKTFEEIDARLQEDLKKINGEIDDIERHLQIAQDMMDNELAKNSKNEAIQNYKKGLEELQKGLEMFLGIKDEIQQTIVKLHETKAKADEHIK